MVPISIADSLWSYCTYCNGGGKDTGAWLTVGVLLWGRDELGLACGNTGHGVMVLGRKPTDGSRHCSGSHHNV